MNRIDDADIGLRLETLWTCDVLVVGSDERSRANLISLLKQAGYAVRDAASGADALLLLDQRPCHIVLTDWQRPESDGLALCRALRSKDSEHYTYVLMRSARSDRAAVLDGLGAGADDYLVKGGSTEELLARVEVGRRITRLEDSLRLCAEKNHVLAVRMC